MDPGDDERLFAALKAACTPLTFRAYEGSLRALCARLTPLGPEGGPGPGLKGRVCAVCADPDGVYQVAARAIVPSMKPTTLKNWITAVKAVHRHFPGLPDQGSPGATSGGKAGWDALFAELRAATELAYDENKPLSAATGAKFVSIAEIVKKSEDLASGPKIHEGSMKASMAAVLMAVYAHIPPKRSDLGAVRVRRLDAPDAVTDDPNFVELFPPAPGPPALGTPPVLGDPPEPPVPLGAPVAPGAPGAPVAPVAEGEGEGEGEGVRRLVIGRHKTAAHFGSIEETLPEPVWRTAEASLTAWPRPYLFVHQDGRTPMSNNAFTKYVARTMAEHFGGRAAGTSMLRHAYVSAMPVATMNLRERKEVATRMGHSVGTQERYRWTPASLVPTVAKEVDA